MLHMSFKLLGGIGLFLLGLTLMADGLKAYAGESLRRVLMRFTGSPLKAFASGALVTGVVQSSSATTVTLIGFVSAGLLTFPQAVGVVFGASLGTTTTGWLVSVLGLQISVGFYALPLVGIGTFLRLLGRGRWRALGLALAGFGLIFIGIQTLQDGMQTVAGRFELSKLPVGCVAGYLLAVGIGFAMTVVMQSSSAAVATTLTALRMSAISFEQATLLVIGAAVGTTVKGALVTIGASVAAKRTALAHILFNLATGVIAVVLLPLFLWAIGWAQAHLGLAPGPTSLAAFHTLFIVVGVVIFLPLTRPFAAWIERLLPEKGTRLTAFLDNSVLNVPAVALEASRRALGETAGELFATLRAGLVNPADRGVGRRLGAIRLAVERIEQFFAAIPPVADVAPLTHWRVTQMHAIDHLLRLQAHWQPTLADRQALAHPSLQPALTACAELLELAEMGLRGQAGADWLTEVERRAASLAERRRQDRPAVLAQTAAGGWAPEQALAALDAMRWLDRIGYHVWRISHYLGQEDEYLPSQSRLT